MADHPFVYLHAQTYATRSTTCCFTYIHRILLILLADMLSNVFRFAALSS